MQQFEVVVTEEAQSQLQEYIAYILNVFGSEQAADAVWVDAMETLNELRIIADSTHNMTEAGFEQYKRINFKHHQYAMIYRVEDSTVYVERIFHQLQDIDNIFN